MIYIVLVNWRGYEDTFECLESLRCLSSKTPFRVIVVDNEASDAGLSLVQAWGEGRHAPARTSSVWKVLQDEMAASSARLEPAPRIIRQETAFDRSSADFPLWLALEDNTGFAAANNAGLRMALTDPDCTHVWFLNNDTVAHPQALQALLDRMNDGEVGLCGSTLIYYSAPDTTQSLGGFFNPLTGRGGHIGMGFPLADISSTETVEAEMGYVAGASMLASRAFLTEVGPMSEAYFLYFEEMDWAMRARGQFHLGWARGSHVYHKEGASIGTSSVSRPSDTSLYYYSINRLRFTNRYHPLLAPLALGATVVKAAAFLFRKDRAAAKIQMMVLNDLVRGRRRRGKVTSTG